MKNLFVFTATLFLSVFSSYAQSETKLNLDIKSKDVDNIRIRSMDNGDLLIFTAKYKSFGADVTCNVFDEDGNFKGKYDDGGLKVFIDKYEEDNDMSASGGSTALTQINESRIFSSKTGKMYLLIQKSNDIQVKEFSFTGETANYDYSSDDFLKPMQLVSWDMKIIDHDILRCMFLYNHKDSGPVTLVSLDYNLQDHSFSTKKQHYDAGILGFSGHERPKLKMLGTLQDNHLLCLVSAGERSKLCVLNQDLSMNLSVDGEIHKPESFGKLIGAEIIGQENNPKKYVALKYESRARNGYGQYAEVEYTRQVNICPVMIEEKGSYAIELGKTFDLPFKGELDILENYKNQLNVMVLKNNRIGVQLGLDMGIYELDEENATVNTIEEKNFRRTLGGLDISPIEFEGAKQEPFLRRGLYGYYYWKNNESEKAIIPYYFDSKTISFHLYSF